MHWIAISGSWREPPERVLADVRGAVEQLLAAGHGVVTGGPLGVDFAATAQVLEAGLAATRLQVFLPTDLATYTAQYRRRARQGVITTAQAEALADQLERVAAAEALTEGPAGLTVDRDAYYRRNQWVVDAADELYAFRVNRSGGVGDTIDRAREAGLPTVFRAYLP